jgi:hypothetical protein
MAGSLLISGNPQQYNAIGEGGQPVYSVAFQLREAVRLKAGAETADCLAVPQSNELGSVIDWYAPQRGTVVPWSAASPEERMHALSLLDAAKTKLDAAAQALEAQVSKSDQSKREKSAVLQLMSKVFVFPDSDFIFLVDGKPVITFWGFHAQGASLPRDPFQVLRPVAPVAVAASAAPVVPARRGLAWWWWLLLLLLLLLGLLFGLRACEDSGPLQGNLPGNTTPQTEVVSGVGVVPPTSPTARPVVTPNSVPNRSDLSTVNTPQADGNRHVVPNAVAVVPEAVGGNGLTPISGSTVPDRSELSNLNPTIVQPDTTQTETKMPPALSPTPLAPAEIPVAAAPEVTDAARSENPPNTTASPTANAQPRDPSTTGTGQRGNPLLIPDSAASTGSTRFLDGSWNAGTGIQDAATGRPLRLEYDFSQGNGQGKVTIKRGDGVQCSSPVAAQMQGKNLQINDRGLAKCSDGSTMALPRVTCVTNASGQADCQGRYDNGTSFPVSMRHAPK